VDEPKPETNIQTADLNAETPIYFLNLKLIARAFPQYLEGGSLFEPCFELCSGFFELTGMLGNRVFVREILQRIIRGIFRGAIRGIIQRIIREVFRGGGLGKRMGGENELGKERRNVEKLGKKIEGEKELGKKRRKAEVLPNRQFEAKTRMLPNHRVELSLNYKTDKYLIEIYNRK
jgi:hypothetical protein